jgi:hypothetical protein
MSRRAPRCSSPRPVGASRNPNQYSSSGEPIQWVHDARCLGVTLDKRLTWSKQIDQVRKKAAQRLGPLMNRRSGLRHWCLLMSAAMRSTQEWPYRPRDVDLRFRAGLRPQIFG